MNTLQLEQKALMMASIKAHFQASQGVPYRCRDLAEEFGMSKQLMITYLRPLITEGFIECRDPECPVYVKPVEQDLSCLAGTPFRAFMGYRALMDSRKAAR